MAGGKLFSHPLVRLFPPAMLTAWDTFLVVVMATTGFVSIKCVGCTSCSGREGIFEAKLSVAFVKGVSSELP